MDWLSTKYIGLISFRLQRFKRVGTAFNFRCPICGDSKTSETKARGWIFQDNKNHNARFHCHNCSKSMSLSGFIKYLDQNLYYEYVKDLMIDKSGGERPESHIFADKMKTPEFVKNTGLREVRKISQLESNHPALLYVKNRMIPPEYHYKLFFSPKFKTWVNKMIPEKFNTFKDEPRLIIPFLDKNKNFIGFQGRSFKKDDPLKYITIMLDESAPKIFGLDDVDTNRLVTVTEGPIDAMFLPNAISSAGGRLETNLQFTNIMKSDTLLVYDNEPRSPETIKKMERAADDGWKITIWPENWQHKDVNDAVLAGIKPGVVADVVRDNSYSGLGAKLKLSTWKKC